MLRRLAVASVFAIAALTMAFGSAEANKKTKVNSQKGTALVKQRRVVKGDSNARLTVRRVRGQKSMYRAADGNGTVKKYQTRRSRKGRVFAQEIANKQQKSAKTKAGQRTRTRDGRYAPVNQSGLTDTGNMAFTGPANGDQTVVDDAGKTKTYKSRSRKPARIGSTERK